MKKLSTFIIAMALIFGMAQCKKQEIPATPDAELQWVHISLKVDGDRHIVYPNTGAVVYTNGDKIYVSNGNLYRGVLTYSDGTFTGNLAYTEEHPMATNDKLHFYFLGGSSYTEPTPLQTTQFDVNISDQRSTLPVLSYGTSKNLYTDGTATYSCMLENKCALVKFDLGAVDIESAITLTGMKTMATINFDGNTVSSIPMMGNIATYGTGSTRYAIVLSDQDAVSNGSVSVENYMGTFSIPTAAYDNALLTNATITLIDRRTPLTLEALTSGTIVVNISGSGGGGYPWPSKGVPGGGGSSNISMKYSVNNGEKTLITTTTTISVSAGDKVQFYGDGTNTTSYKGTKISGGTASVKAYGNIMSLVNETDFATCTTLDTEAFYELFKENTFLTDASGLLLPATTLAKSCYENMFYGCISLTMAPAQLPATTLADECYSSMFDGCTALTAAPALPATTLAESCYLAMFCECDALTAAPALPAETLADKCYLMMFWGCNSLTTAPAQLPAETLFQNCYDRMFLGCTSLSTAPALPATTLAAGCYSGMFYDCTSLNSVTCLATDISASECTNNWLNGVATSGTFTKASGVIWPTGVSGIPSNWTVNEQ